jgi:hypothetical protein
LIFIGRMWVRKSRRQPSAAVSASDRVEQSWFPPQFCVTANKIQDLNR